MAIACQLANNDFTHRRYDLWPSPTLQERVSFGLMGIYKLKNFRYMCVINVWLFLSSLMLIFMFGYIYLVQVLEAYNSAIDYITLSLVMWNFGVVGIMAIHVPNTSPLVLQQVIVKALNKI